jgi:hypothetical protein
MQMSPQEFLDWPRKAITLLGMSGVGKTHLANRLPQSHWFHYSGDYRIGTKYLEEPILDNVKQQAMQVDFLRDLLRTDSIYIANNITVHNLEPVSTFLGKLGRRDLGGLSLAEFKRRQHLHALAEAAAMNDVKDFIRKARDIYGYDNFLNDAGGSIVELEDQHSLQTLADNTLILYLRAGPDMEEELIRRAVTHPKPLYYRDDFLDDRIKKVLTILIRIILSAGSSRNWFGIGALFTRRWPMRMAIPSMHERSPTWKAKTIFSPWSLTPFATKQPYD